MTPKESAVQHRLDRYTTPSLHSWEPVPRGRDQMKKNASLDCGWGRLIFGQTFSRHEDLIELFLEETEGRRDIAMYVWEHHVLLGMAPYLLFLDPSHTYRLWLHNYRPPKRRLRTFYIRPLLRAEEAAEINRIYGQCDMVEADEDTMLQNQATRTFNYFLAFDPEDDRVIGTITGIDHVHAFNDPDNGASFWCLAVDPRRRTRGVGRALVRHTIEHYLARGREYLDLSVLHDNKKAIRLYRSLGFRRVPVYVVKRRNEINRPLYEGGPMP